MSQPARPSGARRRRWNPGRQALWWVLGAFAVGLLLFWLATRGGEDDDFFRAPASEDVPGARVFQPLPAPLPGGGAVDTAPSVMPEGEAEVVEEAPPPPVREPARPAPATPAPRAEPAPPPREVARDTAPRPISQPQPNYPRQSLRNQETGTVRLRVDVGANGRVQNISVTSTSGSRTLDRAAMMAVRNWTFEPARRNGEAVMGTLDVPIEFRLD